MENGWKMEDGKWSYRQVRRALVWTHSFRGGRPLKRAACKMLKNTLVVTTATAASTITACGGAVDFRGMGAPFIASLHHPPTSGQQDSETRRPSPRFHPAPGRKFRSQKSNGPSQARKTPCIIVTNAFAVRVTFSPVLACGSASLADRDRPVNGPSSEQAWGGRHRSGNQAALAWRRSSQ